MTTTTQTMNALNRASITLPRAISASPEAMSLYSETMSLLTYATTGPTNAMATRAIAMTALLPSLSNRLRGVKIKPGFQSPEP